MKWVRNLWYAAAWAVDVPAGAMLYRKIIDEPVLLTRREDGTAVAMTNVCPHRFAPLHLGCRKADRVQCGYHGLEFDLDGRCVHNPNMPGVIPAAMKLRTYPLAEKHTMLWIWMGDPLLADESSIPEFTVMEDGDGMSRFRKTFTMKVNVELIANNVMDLSHASFLHAGLLATPEHADAEITVRQQGRTVTCERTSQSVPVPELFDLLFRRDKQLVDFWTVMRWDPPASFLLDVGCSTPGAARDTGAGFLGIHILTPETATTSHYNVGMVRKPVAEEAQEFEAEIARLRLHAFQNQDEPMMEAMQDMLGIDELLRRRPVLLNIDNGPVRMKKVMDELLRMEAPPVNDSIRDPKSA